MCGRFGLRYRLNKLLEELAFLAAEEFSPDFVWDPRYNIAPTQQVLAIRQQTERPELRWLRWGLIPSWARDVKIGVSLINARPESVAEKPAFRAAFKRRRCLIPSDGFYEWQKLSGGRQKIPHLFTVGEDQLFLFAGLWETWRGDDGATLETCSILTTGANELVLPLHDRMPVILPRESCRTWLDPNSDAALLQSLLVPFPADLMCCRPLSSYVNNARHEGPECVA